MEKMACISIPSFNHIVRFLLTWIILGLHPIHAENKVYLLESEAEGLQAKLDLINSAQKEIMVAYYAIYEDDTGLAVLSACVHAAKRGVDVRIIVESLSSRISKGMLDYLCNYNIPVQYFNKFSWKKGWNNITSMHDKLLVVDGKYFITGGRNLTNNYYSKFNRSKKKFIDLEIFTEGEVVSQASKYFNHVWTAPFTKYMNNKVYKTTLKDYKHIEAVLDSIYNIQQFHPVKYWSDKTDPVQKINFIRDYYHILPRTRFVSNKVMSLIYEADSTIQIESPYLTPPRSIRKALRNAAFKKVKIEINSNAAYVTDVPASSAAYANDRDLYLKWGIHAYEFEGQSTLHSKAMVIDNKITVIGTYNLDNLSHQFNSETITVIEDTAFAHKVSRIIKSRLKQSTLISDEDEPDPFRNLKFKQRFLFSIFRKTAFIYRPFI